MKRAGIFIILLFLINQNVRAQESNQTRICDSLYQTKQFFEFRDSVLDWNASPDLEHRYFRGLAESIFNQPTKAVDDFTAYLGNATNADSISRQCNAFDMLGTNYFRLFRYADAAKTYREAIHRLGDGIDSSQQMDFQNSARLGEILGDTPAQFVMRGASGTQLLPSKAGKHQISVTINNEKVDSDLFFDTGANFSILDSTTAAHCHIKLLNGTISVGSLTGNLTTAHVGVIDTLDLGAISVKNAVVLVFQDADLSFPSIHYHVTGAIGFPVIEALGTVTFTNTGHIKVTINDSKPDSKLRPNLALDGLNLVIEAAYSNQRFPLHFDTGTDATMFYPPFLRKFPNVVLNADTSTHKFSGAGGQLVDAKAYKLRNLQLQLGGKTISFDSVKAVTDRVNETAEFFYGNLGLDATKQFSATTLDFRTMRLWLE